LWSFSSPRGRFGRSGGELLHTSLSPKPKVDLAALAQPHNVLVLERPQSTDHLDSFDPFLTRSNAEADRAGDKAIRVSAKPERDHASLGVRVLVSHLSLFDR
jgi:hypothetical protein